MKRAVPPAARLRWGRLGGHGRRWQEAGSCSGTEIVERDEADHDRPLAKRGRRDAAGGRPLARRVRYVPDAVILLVARAGAAGGRERWSWCGSSGASASVLWRYEPRVSTRRARRAACWSAWSGDVGILGHETGASRREPRTYGELAAGLRAGPLAVPDRRWPTARPSRSSALPGTVGGRPAPGRRGCSRSRCPRSCASSGPPGTGKLVPWNVGRLGGPDGPSVILVGVDDSVTALRAAAYTAGLARRRRARVDVVLSSPRSGAWRWPAPTGPSWWRRTRPTTRSPRRWPTGLTQDGPRALWHLGHVLDVFRARRSVFPRDSPPSRWRRARTPRVGASRPGPPADGLPGGPPGPRGQMAVPVVRKRRGPYSWPTLRCLQ